MKWVATKQRSITFLNYKEIIILARGNPGLFLHYQIPMPLCGITDELKFVHTTSMAGEGRSKV
ncbi:hypothetical protein JCM17380_06630 [Desulfosporosinus burensis]